MGPRHRSRFSACVAPDSLLDHANHLGRRLALGTAMLALASIFVADGWTTAAAGQVQVGRIDLSYEGISDDLASRFVETAAAAADAIENFLGRKSPGPIMVLVNDTLLVPDLNAGARSITIPSNRVRGDAGGPPEIRGRGPAIIHNLVHILAPTRNKDWAGLLDEGFAVYLQEKLGGANDRAFPNMGKDLHQEAARVVEAAGQFVPMSDPVAARTLNEPSCTRQITCIQQGSFVRYLIETYGLAKFMKVYDGDTFDVAFGVQASRLEADWNGSIRAIIDRRRP